MTELIDFLVWCQKQQENNEMPLGMKVSIAYYATVFLKEQQAEELQSLESKAKMEED